MLKDIEKELALLLVSNVENKQMNLTYKEVADILTQKLGRPIDAYRNLNKPLETVARICAELNLPIITVRVIRNKQQDGGRRVPQNRMRIETRV